MNDLKKNDALYLAVCKEYGAVDVVVWKTVDEAVDWGVEGIVNQAVEGAVCRTVSGTVSSASWFGPKYPALQDFMRAVEMGEVWWTTMRRAPLCGGPYRGL